MFVRIDQFAASTACLVILLCSPAWGHFIWMLPETTDDGSVVHIYFSEDATPDNPALLSRLDGMQIWRLPTGEAPVSLDIVQTEQGWHVPVSSAEAANSLFLATHDLGVLTRGDSVFRLYYYAKTGPHAASPLWNQIDCRDHLRLDVVPVVSGDLVQITVFFDGHPIEGAEVRASGPGMEDYTGTTDAHGQASFHMAQPGPYSIRARHIEDNLAGQLDGQSYSSVRHYSTVALDMNPAPQAALVPLFPDLPQPVTSLGAACLDGYLYVYGGHSGGAHSYSWEEQGRHLFRVPLTGGDWEIVAEGPPLQGLALVAHGNRLYRVGGFTAHNQAGQPHDLRSQALVAAFDLEQGTWVELPELPEPRSSHDAAVVGDTLYVVGGWILAGHAEHAWHTTAWSLDLTASHPEWKAITPPPFQRRALALAAHANRLYVLGGMQPEGGPTSRVDVYDPQTGAWSRGPDLPGEDRMTGFGASAFATAGRLYVSTVNGTLHRLSMDGSAWELVGSTPTARFFHRLLPLDDAHLLVVGGANMGSGKFPAVEVLSVAPVE